MADPQDRAPTSPVRFSLAYYLGLMTVIFTVQMLFFSDPQGEEIPYSEFLDRVEANRVATVAITDDHIIGILKAPTEQGSDAPLQPSTEKTPWHFNPLVWFRDAERKVEAAQKSRNEERARHFIVNRLSDSQLVANLQKHGVKFAGKIESHFFSNLLSNWIIPFGLMILLWGFLMRRMGGGGAGAALQVGKNKAKVYEATAESLVRFSDVAGVDEAIEETREIVAFLSEPDRFTRLGAKLPKGVLLVGPPGTGKTLLARAVAGEAGVPFFSLSGSDFVEMFVGLGAARVRDLFSAAQKVAPCIVFIDELDAIGKSRGGQGAAVGGFDERENTLNQLLVEMDGFESTSGVVLMGATNRPEVLDRALMRPGRFDRQILVGRPQRDGRLAIFEIHTEELPLAPDVDLSRMAAQTAGMVGADIANLCNEAALLASRRSSESIGMQDFQDALERVIGGLEKKGRVMNEKDRRTVAVHESGHALVGYFTPGSDPVQKISIVPRGESALGYTLQAPAEDRFLLSHNELQGRIRTLLGGRAAEEIVFGEVSTGASDDLQKASQLARDMLTVYGMSRHLPNLSLVDDSRTSFLGQAAQDLPHSSEIERLVGEEQVEILGECYANARELLEQRRSMLDALAERLLEAEKLDAADLLELLGPRAPETNGSG
ncbi:ATP-dependent zinc metalloprotease FtsH [Myxococcota bacterium]|nr:ATP-dependent zinc metalloprotease FtsH [Myxococcota bacterium]